MVGGWLKGPTLVIAKVFCFMQGRAQSLCALRCENRVYWRSVGDGPMRIFLPNRKINITEELSLW